LQVANIIASTNGLSGCSMDVLTIDHFWNDQQLQILTMDNAGGYTHTSVDI